MNILQLAPRFPFPADDGGKISIANITREFHRRGHDVTLFAFDDINKINDLGLSEAEAYTSRVIFCNHSTKNTLTRITLSLFKNHSLYIEKHISEKAKTDLKQILKISDFHIIHADHSCMAPLALYAKNIIGKPIGLRLHNVEWYIWKRYADNLPAWNPKKIYIEKQALLLRNDEKELYSKVDACFAITSNDQERAIELAPNANVLVAGPGVNPGEWKPIDSIERNDSEMVIATTYEWIHNVDAIRWFIEKVLPLVRQKIPSACLTLIGKNPPEWLKEYQHKGVNVLGYVPEVQSYLSRAAVYVAPLFVGAGIRIKIIEAMAMELPVVATPVSAEGISATQTDGLFIAHDEHQYAKHILKLMSDSERRRASGKAARQYILDNFSWERNIGIMIDKYERLIKSL